MYSDSHVHTDFSGDSDTPLKEQIETAITLGMKELCITDHHDFDVDSGDTDFNLDVERYVKTLSSYQNKYKDRIALHTGIEFGHQSHLPAYEQQFFSRYSFDFVIGSTHFVHGLDPYYPVFFNNRTEKEAYTDYFVTLNKNLRIFDNYDVAGHIDYIVRYGPNKNRYYSYQIYKDYLDEILKTLIDKGKGLECNTSGLRQKLNQPNPNTDILKRYRQLGGEILTLGSDAHVTRDLGFGFDIIGDILKSCGFAYYTTFKNRKPAFHKL